MVRFSPSIRMTSAMVPMAARVQYRANSASSRPLAAQGQHQLQGHAHAGQMLEGIGAVRPVGVHPPRPRQAAPPCTRGDR